MRTAASLRNFGAEPGRRWAAAFLHRILASVQPPARLRVPPSWSSRSGSDHAPPEGPGIGRRKGLPCLTEFLYRFPQSVSIARVSAQPMATQTTHHGSVARVR